MISVRTTGMASTQRRLRTILERSRDKRALFEDAGRYMTGTYIPMTFRRGGPGWPAVARGGRPLQDTGRLRDSIVARATSRSLEIFTNLIYAPVHQYGATILPKRGRYLAIPMSPPLTVTERRTKRPRDFAGTWVMRGPQGFGIYRKAGGSVRVEMIFRLVRSAKVKRRTFLRFGRDAVSAIARRWGARVVAR